MSDKNAERELLCQFKSAKDERDKFKDLYKQAQEKLDKAESQLIEFLEANSAISTAKYEGIGYAQIQKPRLYASCRQEQMQSLFNFLKNQKREDLIKTTVMSQSLSSFTKECIENGTEIPEFINYYLKSNIRFYT